MRRVRLSGSCLCDGEHSLQQEGHAVVAGDGGRSEKLMVRIKMIPVRFTYYKHDISLKLRSKIKVIDHRSRR